MLFEQWDHSQLINMLVESISAEVKDVEKDVEAIMKDLKDEGKDAETDEVKAAILLQAIENDGEIEEIDVEKAKEEVKEGIALRDKTIGQINEAESSIVHAVEVAGAILGNAALLEFIAKKLEKLTGKAIDPGKIKSSIEKVLVAIKKVTGLPGKAISKFFGWAASKLGASAEGKKASELLGMGVLVVILFVLGFVHFPVLGSGILWWVLSLTGLVGKSVELVHIYKEIRELIAKATESDNQKAAEAAKEIGVSQEELQQIAASV